MLIHEGVPQMETLDAAQILMNGTLISRNCGLSVRISAASVQVEKYYSKAVNYTLMMTAVSFFQVRGSDQRVMRRGFTEKPGILRRRVCMLLSSAR